MFLTIECNYIFFITFLFFISLFIINYITDIASTGRYNFSFYFVFILFANLAMLSMYSPIHYELLGVFTSNPNVYFIKISLLFFQFLFFAFTYISYKQYLAPGIFYFFNVSVGSALFMVSTSDYIMTFVLLELASMPAYSLIALSKNRFAVEAAVKYLIFGSFASLLFILSYVFFSNAFAGANYLSDFAIASIFFSPSAYDQLFSFFFFIAIFIKFGVGPFYNWLIDVYQASSYPIFVYNSTLSKLITFAPLYTIGQFFSNHSYYRGFLVALLLYSSFHAAVNIFFQNNVRRFFGYSSVINFSFLIIAVFFSDQGSYFFFKCLFFYTLILFFSYSIFEIFRLRASKNREPIFLEDLGKMGDKYQRFLFASSLLIASGLPPVGLFYAKALTYGLILNSGFTISHFLVAILIVNSILSLFAYFRAVARTYNFSNRQYAGHITISYNDESETMSLFSVCTLSLVISISFFWTSFMQILQNNIHKIIFLKYTMPNSGNNRVKKKFNIFTKKSLAIYLGTTSKFNYQLFRGKRCLNAYFFTSGEYSYKFSGRCTSFRSQGKISSILVRNTSYGVEQRVFINNPRLFVYF